VVTITFQVILKYVAPGQEDIVIQNVCKKLSFAFNDSEKRLETMTEALNEAYQPQKLIHGHLHMMNIYCVIIHKIHRTILKELN
jgi:hypothetical protein